MKEILLSSFNAPLFYNSKNCRLENSRADRSATDRKMTTQRTDEERLQARKPLPPPYPAYLATAGSPLKVDEELYKAIQASPRKLTDSFTLPIRSGRAWKAPAKSIVRISTPEGPQVGT